MPERVELLYHGLDFGRFPPEPAPRRPRTGTRSRRPVILLSVGRAVEKKGYDVRWRRLALLPPDLAWRFVHIGGGTGLKALKAEAARLGIAGRIDWRGAQPQDVVLADLIEADLFFLPAAWPATATATACPTC